MSARSASVTVRLEDGVREGRVVDLREAEREGAPVDAEAVATAVRTGSASAVAVECPSPRPVHEHVGCLRQSMGLRARTALAAAARSRGMDAPQDERLRTVRDRLADVEEPSSQDLAAARRRLAGTETAVDRLRERVATLRGRVQAGREAGRDVADLEADLADAARELSERETDRAAAREALDRAQRLARENRDVRDRRRRLEDRLANVEREARSALVEALREEFADAVAAAPDPAAAAGDAGAGGIDPFEADAVTVALGVGRVADLRAPVVVACDRFDRPDAAADWFDAPVVRV